MELQIEHTYRAIQCDTIHGYIILLLHGKGVVQSVCAGDAMRNAKDEGKEEGEQRRIRVYGGLRVLHSIGMRYDVCNYRCHSLSLASPLAAHKTPMHGTYAHRAFPIIGRGWISRRYWFPCFSVCCISMMVRLTRRWLSSLSQDLLMLNGVGVSVL